MAVHDWAFLEETASHSDGHFRVVTRRFRLPDGKEREFQIREEPSTVAVLAITEAGDVLLTRQFRPGPGEVLYDLPGGAIDEGEEPADAARRELLEETGFEGDLRPVAVTCHDAYSTTRVHTFVARACRRVSASNQDEGEFVEVLQVPMETLMDYLRRGLLTETASAFLALDYLKAVGAHRSSA